MSTYSILNRAAHLIERDGLNRLSVLGAIALSAGQGPEGPLANRAYFAAQEFSRLVLGREISDEAKLRGYLATWVRDTRQTSKSVADQMRRVAEACAAAVR